MACSALHGMGQERQTYVRHFQEGDSRSLSSVHGCIGPQGSSGELTSIKGAHGTHISDCSPKLVGAGLHTTDCHGTGCHDTSARVRSRRSSGHFGLREKLHLTDNRSAGVRCRCLVKERARDKM